MYGVIGLNGNLFRLSSREQMKFRTKYIFSQITASPFYIAAEGWLNRVNTLNAREKMSIGTRR